MAQRGREITKSFYCGLVDRSRVMQQLCGFWGRKQLYETSVVFWRQDGRWQMTKRALEAGWVAAQYFLNNCTDRSAHQKYANIRWNQTSVVFWRQDGRWQMTKRALEAGWVA